MTGDFSRWRAPNARAQGYAGVQLQQGRLNTDADWNENLWIQSHRAETALTAVIGPSGTPKSTPGFAISAGAGGFAIGPGMFWVGGLSVENPAATTYDAQSGITGLPAFTTVIADGAELLVYLEVRQTTVTGLEDALLNDPALSGVDTATRIRAHWRVGVRPITTAEHATLRAEAQCGHPPAFADWAAPTGRMIAGTAPAAALPENADCLIPPDAGYLSQENQLYRVQIIRGGTRDQARFVWSRENGAVLARLALNADGNFVLQGDRQDEALGFISGGWVEVFDDRNTALGQPGTFTRIILTDGVATFSPGIGTFAQMQNPRLRRWDHGGIDPAGLPLPLIPVTLERGVQVAFTDGTYLPGDHWMFEARAATGSVIWPPYPGAANEAVLSMGWGVRHAPLALAQRSGAALTNITDLRALFPALTQLEAEDICYDDSTSNLGATTVQEAIDILAGRQGGLCTITVTTKAELVAAVGALNSRQHIRLCLRGATFALDQTLEFQNLGHVVVEGTGPQTLISVAQGEAALRFTGCASVRVSDLAVNGGPTGTSGLASGRLGALTFDQCNEVHVERVRAKCRNGLDRATACITTRGQPDLPTRSVRIRDCVLTAGQAQIGLNIIDAAQVWVEDNKIAVLATTDAAKVQSRIFADKVLMSRLNRSLLWFSRGKSSLGEADIVDEDGEITSSNSRDLHLRGRQVTIGLNGTDDTVTAYQHPALTQSLDEMIKDNTQNHIRSASEMRHHLRNMLDSSLRNQGQVRLAGRQYSLISSKQFALADTSFAAQGIVIAGATVGVVHVTGNRIDGANEGIHIAASTRHSPETDWTIEPPPTLISRAVISANTITLAPLSTATFAAGINLGHIDRVTASQNAITGNGQSANSDTPLPHYGMRQYGWRGPHLTWTENTVRNLGYGFSVGPELKTTGQHRIWRLRDNSADMVATCINPGTPVDVVF
jgi:hypothetical protein